MAWNNWGLLLEKIAGMELEPNKRIQLLEQAEEKYRNSTQCKPNDETASTGKSSPFKLMGEYFHTTQDHSKGDVFAWYYWGNLLQKKADAEIDTLKKSKLLQQVVEKYSNVTKINLAFLPAWHHLCKIYLQQAQYAADMERKHLLQRAKAAGQWVSNSGDPSSLYDLACCEALLNNVNACIQRLEEAHDRGTLPSREYIEQDINLASARATSEFNEFLKKTFSE